GLLRDSLLSAAQAVSLLCTLGEADRDVLGLSEPPDVVADVASTLQRALVERPPTAAKEGAIFLSGYDARLTECDEVRKNGSALIDALESRLRDETAIGSLKIK